MELDGSEKRRLEKGAGWREYEGPRKREGWGGEGTMSETKKTEEDRLGGEESARDVGGRNKMRKEG